MNIGLCDHPGVHATAKESEECARQRNVANGLAKAMFQRIRPEKGDIILVTGVPTDELAHEVIAALAREFPEQRAIALVKGMDIAHIGVGELARIGLQRLPGAAY